MSWLDDFFGGGEETYTSYDTFVSQLIKPTDFISSAKKGTVDSIFNEVDSFDSFLDSLLSGIGVQAEQMRKYGQTTYSYGNPTGTVVSTVLGHADISPVLELIHGGAVEIEYAHLTTPNNLHFIWKYLVENAGYNLETNILGNLSTQLYKTIFLSGMQLVLPDSYKTSIGTSATQIWAYPSNAGKTPSKYNTNNLDIFNVSVVYDTSITTPYCKITYQSYDSTKVSSWDDAGGYSYLHTIDTFVFDLAMYDVKHTYAQAKYTFAGMDYYFTYQIGLGTYPTLDVLVQDHITTVGTYFPFIHLRQNGVSLDTDKTGVGYKTSKRMTKFLGLDYQALIDGVNTNPDKNKIDQAILMLGVPVASEEQLDIQYLFDYFNQQQAQQKQIISVANDSGAPSFAYGLAALNNYTTFGVVIQDGLFQMTLSYADITKKVVRGNIGKIGYFTKALESKSESKIITNIEPESNIETQSTINIEFPVHYLRKQITATMYQEIAVVDLQMRYLIGNTYTKLGSKLDPILIIPLDHSITDNYSTPVREKLYTTSLHFIINAISSTTVYVSWYETELFSFVLQVISVVIAINTGDWQLVGLAAGSATVFVQLIKMLILKYIEGLIVLEVFKLFVKAIGIKATIAIVIFMAIRGFWAQMQSANALMNLVPEAKLMLQMVTGLSKAITAVVSDMYADLKQEVADFALYVEKQTKLLNTAEEELRSDNWMVPLMVYPDETAEAFYTRTVHIGNPGVLSLELDTWVANMLILPTSRDTLSYIGT